MGGREWLCGSRGGTTIGCGKDEGGEKGEDVREVWSEEIRIRRAERCERAKEFGKTGVGEGWERVEHRVEERK
jgi:hypothetical protein